MHCVQTAHLKSKPRAREGLAEILTESVPLFTGMGRPGTPGSGLFKVRSSCLYQGWNPNPTHELMSAQRMN